MKTLLGVTATGLIVLIWLACFVGIVSADDRTDSHDYSYSMEQSMAIMYHEHAKEMDRANRCYNAIGTYSAIKCTIRERNVYTPFIWYH